MKGEQQDRIGERQVAQHRKNIGTGFVKKTGMFLLASCRK